MQYRMKKSFCSNHKHHGVQLEVKRLNSIERQWDRVDDITFVLFEFRLSLLGKNYELQ